MEATLERHSPVVAAALPHALSTARADLAAAAAALRQNAMPGSGGDARGPLLAMPGARRRRAAALDDVVTITGFVAHIAAGDLAFVFASSLGVSLLRPSASHVAVLVSPCLLALLVADSNALQHSDASAFPYQVPEFRAVQGRQARSRCCCCGCAWTR